MKIFSGIPNPTWELSQDQIDHLLRSLSRLDSTLKSLPEEGLGYNGFRITKEHESSNLPTCIQLNDGIILVNHDNGRTERYLDPPRTLERFLLRTGDKTLEPSLAKEVEEQFR